MIRKTQKQFTGLRSELYLSQPYGSQFIAIDTKELFVYDENGAPQKVAGADHTETLEHFRYDEEQDQLIGDRAIETTLNSLFLGDQHKMSSGAENIFFTNLGNNTNFYPMWGGLKDHSIVANQGADGFIPPSGRVYGDMFSLPLGGNTTLNTTGYSGGNYFGANIAGLGITTTAGEDVEVGVSLVYTLQVDGNKVYKQILPTTEKRFAGDVVEWWFDHPVEIHAGTTIFAEIRKVDRTTDTDFGVFQVREGDELQADGGYRYQAVVHNRLFEDKNILLEGEGDINTDGLQAEIDLNTSERHEHVNKTVLDSFGEDENQQPTYNGNTIDTIVAQRDVYNGLDSDDTTVSLSAAQGKVLKDVQVNQQLEIDSNTDKVGITTEQSDAIDSNTTKIGITPEQAIEISSNTLAKHEHLNKAIIDNFGEDESQKLTYNGEAVGSGSELVTQTLLYERVTWASEQDVIVPTKALGSLDKLDNDAFVTATADGLYNVTIQLNFGNMTEGERLSFALLNSGGTLFPNTGQSFVTASSSNDLQSSQIERTTWRVNLLAGQQLYVGISTLASADLTFDVYSHATHNGSYIELSQLPTQTVVAPSDDVVPVTALFEQRTVLGSNVSMPVTTAGFITFVEQIGVITAPSDGKYLCRVVLPFAGVSDDSWVIRVGVAVMSVGDSVYTPYSEERLQTSVPNFNGVANYDRTIDLQSGDKVVVTVVCNAADSWNIASTNNGCYLDVRQIPTHTVLQTISEEAVVVDDQAASGHVDVGTMRIQWGSINSVVPLTQWDTEDSNDFSITYPVAFGNAPTLTGSLTDGGSHSVNLTFGSVTGTGAVASLKRIDDLSPTNSFKVSWMAIGLKP